MSARIGVSDEAPRAAAAWLRLPRTLFARLAVILLIGLAVAQAARSGSP